MFTTWHVKKTKKKQEETATELPLNEFLAVSPSLGEAGDLLRYSAGTKHDKCQKKCVVSPIKSNGE